jgi:hypothetical protein
LSSVNWITDGAAGDRVLTSGGVSLVHPRRFAAPPESIADLLRSEHHWHLVRGEVLALMPPGSPSLTLPYELPAPHDRPLVLARVDLEETQPFARPQLTTVERARDFYIADAWGRALVRVADERGQLHPDVELHLGAPFVEHVLRERTPRVQAFVRTIAAGDPVYVLGRSRLVTHPEGAMALAGLRDTPLLPCFAGDLGPLHLYDEPAFRQLAAWYALPWYKKLSLLVRNR